MIRSVSLSARTIARALRVRRQSVDDILRRPHVAAMVKDLRARLRAAQALRDWASKMWRGEC